MGKTPVKAIGKSHLAGLPSGRGMGSLLQPTPEHPMPTVRSSLVFSALTLFGAVQVAAAQLPASNPFSSPSPLMYQAPDFNRIHNSDFQPAIEEGMRRQLAEV